jgi:hypothetical protein
VADNSVPAPAAGMPAPETAPGTGPAEEVTALAKPGEGVKLSGTVSYAGSKKGTIHIDLMKNTKGEMGQRMGSVELKAPGPFEIEVTPNAGELNMFAYLDVDGDGFSPSDPGGGPKSLVKVGSSAVTGVAITIVDRK